MTHYDTLGLAREASADEIKTAYRRCSSAAHPDREGGSTERMQAVNQAYAVLGDAARRKAYDETGSDVEQPSLEDDARKGLMELFRCALDEQAGNPVRFVSDALSQHRAELKQQAERLQTKRTRLIKSRGRVKVTSGENLMHALIDHQVVEIDQELPRIDVARRLNEMVAVMLKAYVCEEEKQAQYAAGGPRGDFEDLLRRHFRNTTFTTGR